MKRYLLVAFVAFGLNMGLKAQSWKLQEVQGLGIEGQNAQFDPFGNALFYTKKNFRGLYRLDLQSGDVIQISDEEGAGFSPEIHKLEVLVRVRGQQQLKRIEISQISGRVPGRQPMPYQAYANRDLTKIHLKSTISGRVEEVSPEVKGDYLNISVSPDGNKLLFRVSGSGSFVTDLQGKILFELGNVQFPGWLDNQTVIYTRTTDDGHQFTGSELFMYQLYNEIETALTDGFSEMALYPAVDREVGRIAFHTLNGELYLMTLSRN